MNRALPDAFTTLSDELRRVAEPVAVPLLRQKLTEGSRLIVAGLKFAVFGDSQITNNQMPGIKGRSWKRFKKSIRQGT